MMGGTPGTGFARNEMTSDKNCFGEQPKVRPGLAFSGWQPPLHRSAVRNGRCGFEQDVERESDSWQRMIYFGATGE